MAIAAGAVARVNSFIFGIFSKQAGGVNVV